jgi:hypothetical protein
MSSVSFNHELREAQERIGNNERQTPTLNLESAGLSCAWGIAW